MFSSLFKPKSNGQLSYLADNDLAWASDYEALMQFIPRNKQIPDQLEYFKTSSTDLKEIDKVLIAYQNEDLDAEIFNHPSCQLYLIYLLREKKVSIEFFLHANIYLSALMQYTTIQPLNPNDSKMKEEAEVKIFSLDSSKIFDTFIKQIRSRHCRFYDQKFSLEGLLKNSISQLKKMGKTVIGIKPKEYTSMPSFPLFNEYSTEYPFAVYKDGWYYFPSIDFINTVLQILNPDRYVKYVPILGNINLHTLFKLHQKGYHPINLYSPLVKSNIKAIHGYPSGPFTTLIHDLLVHYYWGSLLAKDHFRFLNEYLLPKVANLLKVNIHELKSNTEIFTIVDLNTTYEQPSPITLEETFYICANTLLRISQSKYFKDLENDKRMIIWQSVYEDKDDILKEFNIDIEDLFFKIERFYMDFYFLKNIQQSNVLRIIKESIKTQESLLTVFNQNIESFPTPYYRYNLGN